MSQGEFDREQRLSKIGERFVYENYPLIFKKLPIVKCELNTAIPGKAHTEGADIETWLMITHSESDEEVENALAELFDESADRQTEETSGKLSVIEAIIKGPVEVKTSSFEQYVARNDYLFDCGVLPFAIWNSNNFENYEEPPRMRLGSLYRMFYPEDAKHERNPLGYVAVFLDMKEVPYACLAFEDFPALKNRLIELGKKYGLDLTREGFLNIPYWDNPDDDRSPDEWAEQMIAANPGLMMKKNMWYVKMSDVIDLARVVLVGNPPKIVQGFNKCSKELQEKRWVYLQQFCAANIPVVTEDRTKEIIRRRREIYELATRFPWRKKEGTGQQEMSVKNTEVSN